MRGVEVRGSLLAGMAAAMVLSLGFGTAAAGETVALSAETAGTDDYYTRRAKRILEVEQAKAAKPHPLAALYPGMDIVVCEAGCPGPSKARVVFVRARAVATEQREAMMVPTSGTSSLEGGATADVACIAGCYGEPTGETAPAAGMRVERMTLPSRDELSPIR